MNWLKRFWNWLKGKPALALRRAERISALAEKVWPAVELVAKLTPTPADDMVLAALRSLGWSAKQILESTDELFRDGARQHLAMEIARRQLVQELQKHGKIRIGDLVLNTIEDVLALDKTQLLAAVQAVVAIQKALQGK